MNAKLKILYIEDEKEAREKLVDLLQSEIVGNLEIEIDASADFETAINTISNYQMVILDIFKGKPGPNSSASGEDVLKKIQDTFFIPVIFYSGNVGSVKHLKSQLIGVVTKGDEGVDGLKVEIKRLAKHNLPFLRERIHAHLENELRSYFWGVIQKQNDIFPIDTDDYSLGYILLRNFADSLSKENIKKIIGDDIINEDKVHPMEFYIYPIDGTKEYESGELVRRKSNNDICIILTPSCDFVKRSNGTRKVESVLLANTILLTNTQEYTKYLGVKKENENKAKYEEMLDNVKTDDEKKELKEKIKKAQASISNLKSTFAQFINSGKGDRFFFLPGTPFVDNRVIDFQKKEMVSFQSLQDEFERVAKLDSPFAQSMVSSFIRYYDRIGFPDIDTDYVINHLKI